MNNRRDGLAADGRFVAKDLALGAGDAEVLAAVVAHYCAALAGDDKATDALAALGVDEGTARARRVGYSDRSLGRALPAKQWRQGGELRSQLARLGVYRSSGHEHFVGCVVVPIVNAQGDIVGLCGRRLERGGGDVWAEGLAGGWFNEPACWPAEVLLARDVFEALAVIGAGRADVIAPGQAGGLRREDARQLARSGVRQLTVLGAGTDEAAERLGREGIEVTKASTRVAPLEVLSAATDKRAALAALVGNADDVAGPAQEAGRVVTAAKEVPVTAPLVSGDTSELHVSFGDRRWRARGGGGRAPAPGS